MSRPTDRQRCAVCAESTGECRAEDLSGQPGDERTHLQFMYDRRIASHCEGLTQEQIDDHMRDYALNRMLAPFRDNLNKKRGKPADRSYKSRNETGARALANLCGAPSANGRFHCIRTRHPDEPGKHKF